MAPELNALLAAHPLPQRRSEDGYVLVGEFLRILRVKIERPVDTVAGVPLLLLALFIEAMERFAAVLVFPFEAAVEGFGHDPFQLIDRNCISICGGHRRFSQSDYDCAIL